MQLTRKSKIAIGVAAACAIYSAGGFWGVPALMQWAARGPATEALGRSLSIEKAEFNPWTLEATAENITMASRDGTEPAVSIGRVYVNAALLETIKRFGVVIQALSVDKLNGTVAIDENGGTNFDDIIARFSEDSADAKSEADAADGKKKKPFPFCINNIELTNSQILVSGPSMGIDEKITEIELAVPFIGTIGSDVEKYVQPRLSFLDNGSPFKAEGETLPFQDSIATKLHAELKDYDLAHLAGMSPVPLDLKVNSGTVSLSADLIFALATESKPSTILLSGSASADRVSASMTGELEKNNSLAFDQLAVTLGELDLVNQSAVVKDVTLAAPKVSLERMANGSLAWAGIVKPQKKSAQTSEEKSGQTPEAKAAAAPAAASENKKNSSSFAWTVEKITVKDGSVALLDHAAKNTRIAAEELQAAVGNLTLKGGEETSFKLSTNTLEGSLTLQGTAHLSEMSAQTHVSAEKLNLAPLSPYGQSAGVDFAGILSTRLDTGVSARNAVDATVKGALTLGSLSVALPESSVKSAAKEISLSGINLAWRGKDSSLALKSDSLRLSGASANVGGELPIDASLGSLTANAVAFSLKDAMSASVGSVAAGKVSATLPVNAAQVTVLTDTANLKSLGWMDGPSGYTRLGSSVAKKIAFEIVGLKTQFGGIDQVAVNNVNAPAQGTITVDSLTVERPRYRISKDAKGNLDIDPLLGKREAAEKAKEVRGQLREKAQKIESKMGREVERSVRVGEIAVNRGFLGFTDHTVNPAGEFRCGDINVSVKPFVVGGKDTPSTMKVTALVNGVSKIDVTGHGSPLADKGKLTAKGSLTAVSMPFFSPYTLHYTSYPIKRGNLTVNADVTVTDKSKLNVDNHITIERLEWGDYIPNSTSSALPVTLASALLTDSKGNVDFGLPISGDLADPTFSISEVVLIALKNLILKVAASPVKLLTTLATFGIGEGATNSVLIPFVAGQSQMGDEGKQIALPIVEALKKNPKSKLEIVPVVAVQSEDQEVHRRTYDGMLKIAMSTLPEKQRTREAAVSKVFKMILPQENQSLPTSEKERKLYQAVKPDINSVINMANSRSKAFSRMLVQNGIEESRIFLAAPQVDKKATEGGVKVAILK